MRGTAAIGLAALATFAVRLNWPVAARVTATLAVRLGWPVSPRLTGTFAVAVRKAVATAGALSATATFAATAGTNALTDDTGASLTESGGFALTYA